MPPFAGCKLDILSMRNIKSSYIWFLLFFCAELITFYDNVVISKNIKQMPIQVELLGICYYRLLKGVELINYLQMIPHGPLCISAYLKLEFWFIWRLKVQWCAFIHQVIQANLQSKSVGQEVDFLHHVTEEKQPQEQHPPKSTIRKWTAGMRFCIKT